MKPFENTLKAFLPEDIFKSMKDTLIARHQILNPSLAIMTCHKESTYFETEF